MIETRPSTNSARALLLFYFLVGFEIVYMISPFGLYYYSVYGMGLDFLNRYALTAWLCSFFLPHIATTSSPILNAAKPAGWLLATIGFIGFCVAAAAVYYNKLRGRGPVTGGIYRYVRHPQYLSLIVCSFGLLLVWPRNLILISWVSVVFAYYLLARSEERECSAKFGPPFDEYVARTGMFLPFGHSGRSWLPRLPASGAGRALALLGIYVAAIGSGLAAAEAARRWSVGTLYASFSGDVAAVSLDRMDSASIRRVLALVTSESTVRSRIAAVPSERALVYIMPAEWYMADLPMKMNGHEGHVEPQSYDRNQLKALVTSVDESSASGAEIVLGARRRTPLAEVRLDLGKDRVLSVDEPPRSVRWGDIPTPIY